LYSQKMKADLIVLPIMRRARLYLNRRRHLLLADLLILLLLSGRLQTLPWKRPPVDMSIIKKEPSSLYRLTYFCVSYSVTC
jgi:hypothetical protein